MFDSLDDQMKHDDAAEGTTRTGRLVRWIAVIVVSIIVFGGLYFGVSLLE